MTKSLSDLTKEDFFVLIGEDFDIGSYAMKLIEVREGSETPPRFRTPFSLSFETPENCSIVSEVLPIKHPKLGQHDLLVTQVAGWETQTLIEVCFS